MKTNHPNHTYYRRNHGQWRSRFQFAMTDWSAFWSASMGLMDRLSVLGMVLTPKLIGAFWIETEVDYQSKALTTGEVLHTTRVFKWGVTLLDSKEVFLLDDNGLDVAIRGEKRAWPLFWKVAGFDGSTCRVHPDGDRADYTFPWFGTHIRQTGAIVEGGADITMETDWARGVQPLRAIEREAGGSV